MSKYIEMFHNIICLDDIYRVCVKYNYETNYRENMPYNEHILAIIFKDKEEIVFNSSNIDEIDREYEKLKNALIENNVCENNSLSNIKTNSVPTEKNGY